MGVEFYSCDECGETFPDCGPCAHCETCEQRLCNECMIKHDVTSHMIDKVTNPNDHSQCPFCSFEIVSDEDLLEYALDVLLTTKEDLKKRYQDLYNPKD